MSAFGGKADVPRTSQKSLLIARSGHAGRLLSLRIFPIVVLRELSDLSPMKACWLHGIVLALLVSLNPLAAQAMDASMATSDHSMPSLCDSSPASEPCCECCPDCDDVAALGACSLLCVNHSGLTGASIDFNNPEFGGSLLTWATCWTDHTIPPDPYPPKAAVII
jgi:hypothetical protein